MGGEAVFKNTRLSVKHVGKMREDGEKIEDILEDYPYLRENDVEFARLYFKSHPNGRPAAAKRGDRCCWQSFFSMRTRRRELFRPYGSMRWMPSTYAIEIYCALPIMNYGNLQWTRRARSSRSTQRDFRKLAQRTRAHPGIIVIPSGASSETQLKLILAAVGWVSSTNSALGFSNRYVEVNAQGEIVRAELLHEGS